MGWWGLVRKSGRDQMSIKQRVKLDTTLVLLQIAEFTAAVLDVMTQCTRRACYILTLQSGCVPRPGHLRCPDTSHLNQGDTTLAGQRSDQQLPFLFIYKKNSNITLISPVGCEPDGNSGQ